MASNAGGRITWPDIMRGVSILWIALFHSFITYEAGRFPWLVKLENLPALIAETHPASVWDTVSRTAALLTAALVERGANAVGVFIILSGFGLTYSLARRGNPGGGWLSWYKRRFLRLYPMYWAAHLITVVAPFTYLQDPIDYRFFWSFLGDRFWPADKLFYYLTPAWWFFGMLIQLVAVFPILFRMLQRMGVGWFLAVCGVLTLTSRYMVFGVLHAHGDYVQGAFFACRLWEFALGMALAVLYHRDAQRLERALFSLPMLAAGVGVYLLGIWSFQPTWTYAATDALMGTGLFVIMAQLAYGLATIRGLGTGLARIGVYSYGLYLLHQPFVMYAGKRLSPFPMPVYLVVEAVVIGVVFFVAMPLEKFLNRLVKR